MFDTHCHLNFKKFHAILPEVLYAARDVGVSHILIPGTDIESSRRAAEIAEYEDNIYAAVGIHPHHVFEMYIKLAEDPKNMSVILNEELSELKLLLNKPKVVAVGEIGLDRHMYVKTKYREYAVTEEFISVQKQVFQKQFEIAVEHNKSLIIHNREATNDLLSLLNEIWSSKLEYKTVIHCCEPLDELLTFAREKHLFIGVDGDITYGHEKADFIKKVPHEMLVLETDAPFLLPEPLKSEKKYPNTPSTIPIIAKAVASAWNMSAEQVGRITLQNGKRLFGIT